jgi:hypothetical protein
VRRKFFWNIIQHLFFLWFCMLILMGSNMKRSRNSSWTKDRNFNGYLWVNTLVKGRRWFYADYEPTKAARAIWICSGIWVTGTFVCVENASGKGICADKIAAYQTLYTCLLTISKLGAPIAPFFMDKLYRDLTVANRQKNLRVYIWHSSQFRLKTMLIKC